MLCWSSMRFNISETYFTYGTYTEPIGFSSLFKTTTLGINNQVIETLRMIVELKNSLKLLISLNISSCSWHMVEALLWRLWIKLHIRWMDLKLGYWSVWVGVSITFGGQCCPFPDDQNNQKRNQRISFFTLYYGCNWEQICYLFYFLSVVKFCGTHRVHTMWSASESSQIC
jgi:hypothetical protein